MEKTFVIVKPDTISRMLVGEVVRRIEQKGLQLVGCKMAKLDKKILDEHYGHLKDKPFFPRIAKFMGSSPVLLLCWEGKDAVNVVRKIVGVTNGREADNGTIRGDFSMSVQCNLVHASDSVDTAREEIDRFFSSEEIFSYQPFLKYYMYADDET